MPIFFESTSSLVFLKKIATIERIANPNELMHIERFFSNLASLKNQCKQGDHDHIRGCRMARNALFITIADFLGIMNPGGVFVSREMNPDEHFFQGNRLKTWMEFSDEIIDDADAEFNRDIYLSSKLESHNSVTAPIKREFKTVMLYEICSLNNLANSSQDPTEFLGAASQYGKYVSSAFKMIEEGKFVDNLFDNIWTFDNDTASIQVLSSAFVLMPGKRIQKINGVFKVRCSGSFQSVSAALFYLRFLYEYYIFVQDIANEFGSELSQLNSPSASEDERILMNCISEYLEHTVEFPRNDMLYVVIALFIYYKYPPSASTRQTSMQDILARFSHVRRDPHISSAEQDIRHELQVVGASPSMHSAMMARNGISDVTVKKLMSTPSNPDYRVVGKGVDAISKRVEGERVRSIRQGFNDNFSHNTQLAIACCYWKPEIQNKVGRPSSIMDIAFSAVTNPSLTSRKTLPPAIHAILHRAAALVSNFITLPTVCRWIIADSPRLSTLRANNVFPPSTSLVTIYGSGSRSGLKTFELMARHHADIELKKMIHAPEMSQHEFDQYNPDDSNDQDTYRMLGMILRMNKATKLSKVFKGHLARKSSMGRSVSKTLRQNKEYKESRRSFHESYSRGQVKLSPLDEKRESEYQKSRSDFGLSPSNAVGGKRKYKSRRRRK